MWGPFNDCDTITVSIVNQSTRDVIRAMSAAEESDGLLTLDELTERVGLSVRNVRFYTSRGLVPSPIRIGRQGFYSEDHVARLELLRELQSHGFTLAAIERYVDQLPDGASPETIALHRTLLTPRSEPMVTVGREELDRRAGRELGDSDLEVLVSLGAIVRNRDGTFQVSGTSLVLGLGIIDIGFPIEAAKRTSEVYRRHGRQIAEELSEIFRTEVRPVLEQSGAGHDALREMLQRINPMSIAALVSAYEEAVEDLRRASTARRTSR